MKLLKFCYPNLTRTISLTGTECALSCAHCGGHYLKFMETPRQVQARGPRQYRSALISGGYNLDGWVPLRRFEDFLVHLRDWKWRLNFHTGLLPEDAAGLIRCDTDVISFDYITDDRTIREVYGLKARGEDYYEKYYSLSQRFKVIPHITLGLLGGEIYGEKAALESLSGLSPGEIVFLIFTPTRNTKYYHKLPPSLEDIEKIFKYARQLFPHTTFSLGCMRPRGENGRQVEQLALKYRFSKFVLPSKDLSCAASEKGYQIENYWECCVL